MANPAIAWLKCAHCKTKATVHQESTGKKALYYRCYDGPRGACGTVQIRYPGGQWWIRKHMQPFTLEEQDQQADDWADDAKDAVKEGVRKARKECAKMNDDAEEGLQVEKPEPNKKGGGFSGLVSGMVKMMKDED